MTSKKHIVAPLASRYGAKFHRLNSTAIALALTLVAPQIAGAQTWDGSTDTDWFTGSNWVGDAVPAASGAVTINDTSANNVSVNAATATVASVGLSGSVGTPRSLTITGTGDLKVSGSVTVGTNSTLTVNSSGKVTGAISGTGGTVGISGTVTGNISTSAGTVTLNTGASIGGTAAISGTGTLSLAADQTISSVSGSGGTLALGTKTLTTGTATDSSYSGGVTGSAGSDLTKQGTGKLTISGTVNTAGTITIDAGTLELSGTNTISGGITVDGRLILGSNGAAGGASGQITTTGSTISYANGVNSATPITIASATTKLDVATGDAAEQSGVIDEDVANRPLEKIGGGNLTLSAANTYTGTTKVSAGTLTVTGSLDSTAITVETGAKLSVDGSALDDAAAVTLNGTGDLTLTGNETIGSLISSSGTSTVTLGSNTLTTGGNDDDSEFAGVIGGTNGALIKAGTGTFTLSGANTYTGSTTVNGGTLTVTGAIASATITVGNGAKLSVDGSALDDAAAVTLNGTGNLTLTGNETIGSLISSSGTSTVTLGSNTLTTGGNDDDSEFAGVIGGTNGALIKAGTGTFTLSGTNTYTGSTTVNGGTLTVTGAIASATITVATGATLSVDGSALDDEAAVTLNGSGNLTLTGNETIGSLASSSSTSEVTLGSYTLTTGGNDSNTSFAGDIGGTGNLEKTGTGTFTLTNTNSYSGSTTVVAGVLKISDSAALGTTVGGTTVKTGAVLALENDISVGAEDLALNGDGISSGGALRSLSGDNSFDGDITLESDSRINTDADSLTLGGAIDTAGFELSIGGAGDTTADNVISGAGSLVKDGAGTLTLTDANTYAGSTTVAAGTLAVTGSIASTDVTIEDGAVLSVDNGDALDDQAAVTINDAGELTLLDDETIGSLAGASADGIVTLGSNTLTTGGNDDDSEFAGVIDGTGGLIKEGTGTFTLSGANTYTGDTTVNDGTLELAGGAAIDDTADVVMGGGTLSLTDDETIALLSGLSGTVELGTKTLTTGTATDSSYSGGVTGSAGSDLTKQGTGKLTISGTVNTAGTITIDAGTLELSGTNTISGGITVDGTLILGSNGAAGGASGQITTTGSVISYADGVISATPITIASDTTQLEVATGDAAEQSGVIDEDVANRPLEKIGEGKLTLSATNSYTGDTTVSAGTLVVTGYIASTAITVASGAKLSVDGAALSNSAAVTLNGTGDLTLTGSETIGSLISSSNTATVTLGTNTLTTGGDNSSTTFAGAIGAVGDTGGLVKAGTGTFTLSGANTYVGDTTISAGKLVLTSAGSLGATDITTQSGATMVVTGASLAGAFTNNGTLQSTGNTTISGAFANNGTVDLTQNATTGDLLTLSGGASGTGAYKLDINLTTGATDYVDASGSGLGAVDLKFSATGGGILLGPVEVFRGAGASASLTQTGLPVGGAILYNLNQNGEAIEVLSRINPAVGGVAAGAAMTQSLIGTVVNRPTSPFVSGLAAEESCSQGGYFRATAGIATIEGTATSNALTNTSIIDSRFSGVQGGYDYGCYDGRFNGWDAAFGLMAGYNTGSTDQGVFSDPLNQSLQTGTSSSDFDQTYLGLYAAGSKDRVSGDLQLRFDRTTFDLSETFVDPIYEIGLNGLSYSTESTTVGSRFNYRFDVNTDKGVNFVPTIGFNYTSVTGDMVTLDDMGTGSTADDETLKINPYSTVVGFFGGTLARTKISTEGSSATTTFVSGNYYKDFGGTRTATYDSVALTDGPATINIGSIGGFAEASFGVNYVKILENGPGGAKQLNANLRADARFGGNVSDSYSLTAQIRLSF